MITAKCIQKSNPDYPLLKHDLVVSQMYEVDSIDMGSCHTYVYLKDRPYSYNSVYLEFYEDLEPLDIFNDKRFNPYIK